MRAYVSMHSFEHASMMSAAKAVDWQQLSLLHDATEPAIMAHGAYHPCTAAFLRRHALWTLTV